MGTDAPSAARPVDGHVPVEHRWFGLDRRTLPLTLCVLAVMVVYTVVLPAIDNAVGWDDETSAGDVIDLGEGVTFVPPAGWELTDGIRVGDEPLSGVTAAGAVAALGNGGVRVVVERSGFDGTADELLDQVNRTRSRSDAAPNRAFKVTGPRDTVTTASGISGVSEAYTSANGEGRVLAFTLGAGGSGEAPTGVVVTVDATASQYATQSAAVDALIASIAYDEAAS
ncbi:MAG TPA: hypothetical protein VFS16_16345 [Acidimicrobiia bacterium]|nr:hypothetical protein [Acidimicrobiia bacterium]